MKLALAQLNYSISDFSNNTKKIIDTISLAKTKGCQLIIFSEACISGYLPCDLLLYPKYLDQCLESIKHIATHCTNITAVIGSPTTNYNNGKRVFNSAIILKNGLVEKTINKTLIPYYDVFTEQRYFEKGQISEHTINIDGVKIAIMICEDIWFKQTLHTENTLKEISEQKPDLIINISASPFDKYQYNNRINAIKNAAKTIKAPIIYVNQVGANNNLIFDGNSIICDKNGHTIENLKPFDEDFYTITFNSEAKTFTKLEPTRQILEVNENKNIVEAIILGIKDYFNKTKFKKAILGLSGGIDSAVSLVLASLALGKENVKAILMPSEFSSRGSISDSIELVNNINCKHEIIRINSIYDSFLQTLEPIFNSCDKDVTEENLQARIRANILLALSNKFGYLVLNTSNKSELAVGYGTLYGDMCGAISIIGDLYKTEVYEIAKYLNSTYNGIIPENIITKEPSAELSHNQKDSDTLPEYNILDRILSSYIDQKLSKDEIISLGYNDLTVKHILTLINKNEYKRAQFAPILRVSKNSFTDAWKMPIVKAFW